MKYYFDPRSGSCRRVSAVISHLNLDIEAHFVDLLSGANKTPDFEALNPNTMVPVLADGDLVLWEASAIMIYLCEKSGPTHLWPEGTQRHEVLKWMFWAAEHFRIPAPIYFEENVIARLFGNKPDENRLAEADRRIEQFAPVLERHLEGKKFVVGDAPTLADLDLAVVTSQMPRSHVPYERFPQIMAWVRRLEDELPAWRETGALLDAKMNDSLENAAAAE